MRKTECTITDGKKQITVQPSAMTIFLQGKMVEAWDKAGNVYYMMFFKDEYLTTMKAESVRRRSFLEKGSRYGAVYKAPHPFIHEILSGRTSFPKRSLSQLRGKFQSQHTYQETARMLTFFDTFTSKKDLFQDIQSYYYQHRRSGQLFLGYRILRVLLDFTPKHSWVKQLANDMEFSTFKDMYQRMAPELWEKDPLFMEKACYYERKDPDKAAQLLRFLKEEKRWVDAFSLMIDQIRREGDGGASYDELMQWLNLYYDKEEQQLILEDIYEKCGSAERLREDLLHLYLGRHDLEKTLRLLQRHELTLTEKQENALEEMLDTVDLKTADISLDDLSFYIASMYETAPRKAEKVLHTCVNELLAERPLPEVLAWLAPIREKTQASPVIQQIEKMKTYREDPEKQRELGEMLYDFNQLDQAIDCFSWEMEMNTTDPEPVRWLSKIYLDLGRDEESKAYQDLYRKMQKANA
ncbi:tetratricopeptide repeat protein [Salibacterium sp. K-3]